MTFKSINRSYAKCLQITAQYTVRSLASWALRRPSFSAVCRGTINVINAYSLAFGAAYGTAKSGVGISAMGVLRPDLVTKSIVPVVMAGIIAIYGLVVSVLVSGDRQYQSLNGFAKLILQSSRRWRCTRDSSNLELVYRSDWPVLPLDSRLELLVTVR